MNIELSLLISDFRPVYVKFIRLFFLSPMSLLLTSLLFIMVFYRSFVSCLLRQWYFVKRYFETCALCPWVLTIRTCTEWLITTRLTKTLSLDRVSYDVSLRTLYCTVIKNRDRCICISSFKSFFIVRLPFKINLKFNSNPEFIKRVDQYSVFLSCDSV